MYECKKCNKSFEKRHAYIGHCSSHNRGESYIIKRKSKNKVKKKNLERICPFCNVKFEKYQQLGGHINNCVLNPNFLKIKTEKSIKLKKVVHKPTSREVRDKISKSRINYLFKNPEKVPYRLNHSSKESYPEKIFRIALEQSGIIGWKQEYQNSIYRYDFAFLKQKIDIEIDGSTHLTEKVKIIDQRRDEWSKSQGWVVLRFQAKEVKNNVIRCIEILKQYL